MWLITTLISAIIATVFFYILRQRYKLGFLSLMLWGATIMILIDHWLGYDGGQFLELETDGLVRSGTWLGILMLIPILIIWLILVFTPQLKYNFKRMNK